MEVVCLCRQLDLLKRGEEVAGCVSGAHHRQQQRTGAECCRARCPQAWKEFCKNCVAVLFEVHVVSRIR